MKIITWILGVAVGGFVLMMIIGTTVGNTPEGKGRQFQRDKIEFCWKDQARKSLDPGSARFVAGVCEKLEADFLTQWGYKP